MLQEIFRIPFLNIPIYGYGLMLVIGYICAVEVARFLARRVKIHPDIFTNVGLIALASGVAGSRLSHVIENWSDYTRPDLSFLENLYNAVNIRSGGLTFYGGLILGFVCVLAYGFKKRVPIRVGMDVLAGPIMIGLAFGRIGCFLNGCCYGAECQAPYAISFPYHSVPYIDQFTSGQIHPPAELLVPTASGSMRLLTPEEIQQGFSSRITRDDLGKSVTQRIPVPANAAQLAKSEHSLDLHPAQLYSSFDSFLVAATLIAYFTMPHAPGRVFALMLLMMAPVRFLTEMVRAEPPVMWIHNYGLSFSMVLSCFFLLTGSLLWFTFGKIGSKHEWTTSVAPPPLPA